jgi:threonylcarbamoyladenosine tRNA methylthiotransferase MtaB
VAAARGESRSLTLEAVVGWVRRLAAEGAREVVVCGTNLGAWGADLRPRRSFAELVGALEQCEVLERYRLGSIEPWAFDDAAAVEAIARARKVAPHLHLPLQSGDPATLRRMGRHQSPEGFATVVERLRAAVPGLAVGVDVIAGLPGESDEAFARTIALLDAVTPAYLHGFGFSPRPGTAAAAMRDRPDGATVGRRVAALAARGRDLRRRFAASLVGDVVRALVVRRSPRDGRLVGLAGRYVFVRIDGGDDLVNCIVEVAVERAGPAGDVEGRALRVDRPATAPQTQRDHNERCNP